MPPNVLLIVLDAARADHFEPYGAPAGSTPVIADLARAGSHVPHAYAAASWTVPSHAALFSGLLPRAAGLSRAPERTPQSCRPTLEALAERLLPEVLHRVGYETRALSTNAWLLPGSGFDTGFERFELVDPGRHLAVAAKGRRNAVRALLEGLRARVDDGAAAAGQVLRRWMDEPHERPFFWFVNLVEAHSPYLPPKPFNDLGPAERVRAALDARRYLTLDAVWRASLGQLDVPDDVLERMRHLYAASIRSLDAWVGDVLDGLERARLLDDTLVVVTADHGENLGESGMLGHAFSLDERLLRVPLVSAGPVELGGGEVFSLVSLPSRLGDALAIPEHPWEDPLPEGVAVAQFDPPTAEDDSRNKLLLDLWGVDDPDGSLTERLTSELTAASDGTLKLVRRGDSEELYDLAADPLERHPLAATEAPAEPVVRLRAALDQGSGRAAPATASSQSADEEVGDLEERMRLLGYL